jgi:hypothetical protein
VGLYSLPAANRSAAFDYNPLTLAHFKKETGIDAKKFPKNEPKEWKIWQDWKTRQVTEVVEELRRNCSQKRPKWEISAAVFPDIEENLRVKQQDWKVGRKKATSTRFCRCSTAPITRARRNLGERFSPRRVRENENLSGDFHRAFLHAKRKKYDERYLDFEKNSNSTASDFSPRKV